MLRNDEKTEYQTRAEYIESLRGGAYEGTYDNGKSPNDGLSTNRTPDFIGDRTEILPYGIKPDESKQIRVRSNLKPNAPDKDKDVSFPVAIFEKSEAHPNGEIYIADNEIHEVGYTERVIEKLTDGVLVVVKQ